MFLTLLAYFGCVRWGKIWDSERLAHCLLMKALNGKGLRSETVRGLLSGTFIES